MEQLPALGTAIFAVAQKTFAVYKPLLLENAGAIKATCRKTFQYGPHPRQELDVYYPSQVNARKVAIFVFLHGGGLVRGDKILPGYANGLAHANLGHFLAENLKCVAVVPNYRLISHGAVFPSGGEDIALTVDWIARNLANGGNEPTELFLMGNSAGGIHLSTFLFSPDFESARASILPRPLQSKNRQEVVLRGIVMLSVPFHFKEAIDARAEVLKTYFGENVQQRCPLGLLEALNSPFRESKGILPGVRMLVLNGSLDPDDEILRPRDDFVEAWRKVASAEEQKSLSVEMMDGHNHISPPLSLGTNVVKEEAWGYQVAQWMETAKCS